MPRVTEPMSAELLASPGLPEVQGPVLPGLPPLPLPLLASAALRDKPGAPEALTQLHLSSSRWAAALLCLPFHFSSHWLLLLVPLMAEKWLLSRAQVCPWLRVLVGSILQIRSRPGKAPCPRSCPQTGCDFEAWDGYRCQRTGGSC